MWSPASIVSSQFKYPYSLKWELFMNLWYWMKQHIAVLWFPCFSAMICHRCFPRTSFKEFASTNIRLLAWVWTGSAVGASLIESMVSDRRSSSSLFQGRLFISGWSWKIHWIRHSSGDFTFIKHSEILIQSSPWVFIFRFFSGKSWMLLMISRNEENALWFGLGESRRCISAPETSLQSKFDDAPSNSNCRNSVLNLWWKQCLTAHKWYPKVIVGFAFEWPATGQLFAKGSTASLWRAVDTANTDDSSTICRRSNLTESGTRHHNPENIYRASRAAKPAWPTECARFVLTPMNTSWLLDCVSS